MVFDRLGEGTMIKEGDKITIAGIKMLPSGRLKTNCKSGEETIFILVEGK